MLSKFRMIEDKKSVYKKIVMKLEVCMEAGISVLAMRTIIGGFISDLFTVILFL